MRKKKFYQLKKISGQLDIKVIHVKLVFNNVEFLNECSNAN